MFRSKLLCHTGCGFYKQQHPKGLGTESFGSIFSSDLRQGVERTCLFVSKEARGAFKHICLYYISSVKVLRR